MADDLYTRYMAAYRTWCEHTARCTTCTTGQPACPDGTQLHERFTRLQDAYLNRQRKS
ncbi:hypothetical protein [Streptomyces sp. A5-4]|uniref:hypothetical protein n=1 Tax=Streptomyces sp. A5-4 TaxID=3384771 RepID=UPI003DA8487E